MELIRVAGCKCSFLLARIYTEFPQNPTAFNLLEETASHSHPTLPQEDWKKQDQATAADLGKVAWELGDSIRMDMAKTGGHQGATEDNHLSLLLPGYLGISEVSLVRMVRVGFPLQGNEL